MADKLKRCPFCGGEAEWSYLVPDGAIIGCKDAYSANPKCRIKPEIRRYRGNKEKSLEIAISDWNNRPSPWHTGTPTEDGWYVLECNIGNSDGTYYATDYWNNEVGYWTVNRVIRWQKIEED